MKYFFRLLLTVMPALFSGKPAGGQDSCGLNISLLTCSPGTELYSTFGHSALRVTDAATGTDIVYNFGTFDFYDPGFLMKFTRGQLLYYLDQQSFSGFLKDYQMENRSVREQVLSLDCEAKKAMQQSLFINMREENRSYKYDFLFDNCTTRLRDLILRQNPAYRTAIVLPHSESTFRNHIHFYLNQNRQFWSKLGIDILLGKKMDRVMTNDESMFLPDYLEKGLDSSSSATARLVQAKTTLFQKQQLDSDAQESMFTPGVFFWTLLLAVALIGFLKSRRAQYILMIIDFLIFFLNGLLGCLILFMWFGTDHNTTQNNFNLLWALPTHVVFAFLIRKNNKTALYYFRATAVLCIVLLLSWFFLPQELNNALIPWVMLTGLRALLITRAGISLR